MTNTVTSRTILGKPRRSRVRWQSPGWLLVVAEVALPLILLIAWWVLSAGSTNTFFPPLQAILTRLSELLVTPAFLVDIASSVTNMVIAFVIATVCGVVLGVALGMVRWLSWLVEPTVHFFRAIPPVALVPIFVSLIGFGTSTRIVSIAVAAVMPTFIAALDGVRAIDPTMTMVTKAYRLPRTTRLFRVVLPAASPRIFSGMEVSLLTAFIVMIASEMLGSSTGLGAATLQAQQSFMITDMWAGVLVLGIIGYLSNALFKLLRRRVLRWYLASQQLERQS